MIFVAKDDDPYAAVALVISQWALGISALTFVVSIVALWWTIREWRHSGARVDVSGTAWRSPTTQRIHTSIRNHGRTAITVNYVLLFASGRGRQPDREAPAMFLGSRPGEPLADVKPYRLEPQSSLELEADISPTAPFYGLPRYWVDVELATGKVRKSGWIQNN
ncbi:hypothetical protein K0817_009305 [Microbacterium sp. HD4P20]|uniref:hypothetical protein n=1 Tax=Microbacterium sp. HD4P20 TaxID=2864874 RepID=UPI001C643CC5|nr:hypothetical protein [Microbacterium sp. HD4P20]MCP2636760.1 hypothetical protein [Microbacterium sp. HD4P20]